MNVLQRAEWRLYKGLKRLRLKNRNATIISSNCNGEFIYYDMRMPFLSPTINLSFDMNDYVKLVEKLHWYMEQPGVGVALYFKKQYWIRRYLDDFDYVAFLNCR